MNFAIVQIFKSLNDSRVNYERCFSNLNESELFAFDRSMKH